MKYSGNEINLKFTAFQKFYYEIDIYIKRRKNKEQTKLTCRSYQTFCQVDCIIFEVNNQGQKKQTKYGKFYINRKDKGIQK